MTNRAKRFWLSALVTLLVVPLLGCGFMENLMNPSALSREQAIAIVLVPVLPTLTITSRMPWGKKRLRLTVR